MNGRFILSGIFALLFFLIWLWLIFRAIGCLLGRPLSGKWIKVTAELKPLSDAEDLQVQMMNRMAEIYAQQTHAKIAPPAADAHSAVYTVDGKEYRQTVRGTKDAQTMSFYVSREDPQKLWSPKVRWSKPAAAAILAIAIAALVCFCLIFLPLLY